MRNILTLLLTVFMSYSSYAQQVVLTDTGHVQARQFDDTKTRAFKNDPAFQYERLREPPTSPWDRFWGWVWYRLRSILFVKTW